MATTARFRRVVKKPLEAETDSAAQMVGDHLEALARQGARTMLMAALGEEVDAFLGRGVYQRGGALRGYCRVHPSGSSTRLVMCLLPYPPMQMFDALN